MIYMRGTTTSIHKFDVELSLIPIERLLLLLIFSCIITSYNLDFLILTSCLSYFYVLKRLQTLYRISILYLCIHDP